MATKLDQLQEQKKELETQLSKIEPVSKAFLISDSEIYDYSPWPYFLTGALMYKAGETFEDISYKAYDNDNSRSKVGKALNTAVWYTLAGASAIVVGACAIPFAILETPFAVPVKIHEALKTNRQWKYNSRVRAAKNKTEQLKKEIETIDNQIKQEQQNQTSMEL